MNLDCSTPPATWTRSRQKNIIWKVATKIVLVVQTHLGTGPPEGEIRLFSPKSSVKSPESGLFSDWSGNKRQHKAVCTLRARFAPLLIPANEATSGKLWLAHSYLMASLTLSLTDTLIGGRQTIQQVIVSGFPFFFALPPPRKKRKPDRRLRK